VIVSVEEDTHVVIHEELMYGHTPVGALLVEDVATCQVLATPFEGAWMGRRVRRRFLVRGPIEAYGEPVSRDASGAVLTSRPMGNSSRRPCEPSSS
jgi:hypothetical protein